MNVRFWNNLRDVLAAFPQGEPRSEKTAVRSASHERVLWVDYAKGICIIAVVMMYAAHHVEQIKSTTGWMQYVVDFAQPFRMPDFFMLAGLFVAHALRRPLRAYLDTKVIYFVYFYAIWVTFRFAYLDLRQLLGVGPTELLANYAWMYIQPSSGPLWFIYILALFFVTVRLAQNVPPKLVFAIAIGLQLVHFDTGVILLDKFTHYFVYFYSGYVFAPYIFRFAYWAETHPRVTLLILSLWFAVNSVLVWLQWASLPGVSLFLGYAGAIAITLSATLLANVPWSRWLRYLGQHSIVVYLGFVIPLGLMKKLVFENGLIEDPGNMAFLATVGSVFGAVALYWLLRDTPLRFLYSRPRWISVQTKKGTALDEIKEGRGLSRQTE